MAPAITGCSDMHGSNLQPTNNYHLASASSFKAKYCSLLNKSLTVQAFFVHDGAAPQCLIVLLVTHQGVHAKDGYRDRRT